MAPKSISCDRAIVNNLTQGINKTQKEISDIQKRSSSDVKHQHYYDIDTPQALQSIQVEYFIRQSQAKIKNYQWAESMLYMQEESLQRFGDIIEDAKKLCAVAMNQIGNRATPLMQEDSQGLLSKIQDEFSTSYFGMNIWNGSRTNEKPWGDIVNGNPGENYYLGDNFDLQFFFDGTAIKFGDRANYDCFTKLVEAIQMMRDSQDPDTKMIDKDIVAAASAMVDDAMSGFTGLIQKAGSVQQEVRYARSTAEEAVSNAVEMYNSLNGMDEVERAITAIDAAAVQRKLGYMIPLTMKYLNDMSVIKYL